MKIFRFRDELVQDYAAYSGSFLNIRDARISAEIQRRLESGELWPKPLITAQSRVRAGSPHR